MIVDRSEKSGQNEDGQVADTVQDSLNQYKMKPHFLSRFSRMQNRIYVLFYTNRFQPLFMKPQNSMQRIFRTAVGIATVAAVLFSLVLFSSFRVARLGDEFLKELCISKAEPGT